MTETLAPIEGALETAITELLRTAPGVVPGTGSAIAIYERLTGRMAMVGRVTLGRDSTPRSVIVKHVHASRFPLARGGADSPEFTEELAVHHFLRAIGLERVLKPAMIASDPRGVLILEDLGPSNFERQRTFAELIPMIALALAKLHGGTMGRLDDYLAERAKLGLLSPENDTRRHSGVADRHRFRAGAARLNRRCDPVLDRELNAIAGLIENPDEFACLLHQDLANARQTFETPAGLLLLDFEYAFYGHALLDLVKPMIGKFEIVKMTGVYVWTCPGFGLDLASEYRARLAEQSGRAIPDAAWGRNLAAALVYGALALAGRALEYPADIRMAGTPAQNINGIVYRLARLLSSLEIPDVLRAAIDSYTAHQAHTAVANPSR